MKLKYKFSANGDSILEDILHFSSSTYFLAFVFGVLGGIFSAIYSLISPVVFEATAQVQMAQIFSNSAGAQKWGAIEDPGTLIARFSMPTSYTEKEVFDCGLGDQPNGINQMVKKIRLLPARGAASTVELKVRATSKDSAYICANAVYELIKSSQARIIAPYIDEARTQLEADQKQLYEIRKMILESGKSSNLAIANYLNIRDEIQYLRDSISVANKLIIGASNRPSQLTSPIYVNPTPISPSITQLILFGSFGGVILGLLISFFRRKFNEYEDKAHINI